MGNAFILIVVGLVLYYVVLSDKFYCIEGCAACLMGDYQPADPVQGGAGTGINTNTPSYNPNNTQPKYIPPVVV